MALGRPTVALLVNENVDRLSYSFFSFISPRLQVRPYSSSRLTSLPSSSSERGSEPEEEALTKSTATAEEDRSSLLHHLYCLCLISILQRLCRDSVSLGFENDDGRPSPPKGRRLAASFRRPSGNGIASGLRGACENNWRLEKFRLAAAIRRSAQIYRVPPPENARKYQLYTRRKHRHNQRRCCLCTTLVLLLLAVLVAVSACILYLIYRPKSPSYSVQSVSVEGINLTSSTTAISPDFNVTLRAENPNKKIGIYYEKGSSFKIYHNDVEFSEGSLPAFYQPPENVTLFSMILTGSNIVLSTSARQTILTEQNSGKVPLNMHVKLPVKIKLGAVKTWTVTVKVSCAVTVSGLTANSKVVSKACDVSVKPW
ncbi:hypothetical protein Nepgr_013826 [Nepenthes gracilis]|uniref:Late embryogenesis abundant protein LEA-2 subgroup domain-containing protein n=1 Tax=Nepenthes gracilis TaxID=150966 RepID=A0AAD3XPS8_NEPGR|nr:hypothetical protein Nepgr_013826 [Nepenthes gracilis]